MVATVSGIDHGPWRLLDTGVRSAAENVALDQALLVARSRQLSPNTLRFLQFYPPAVLVGYHQAVTEEVRLDYCRAHGIEVGRRITGGGAIYLDPSQIGWEIVAARDAPGIPRSVEAVYGALCEGAVRGLRKLGISAEFRPRNDIEVLGRKISGTGGTELDRALLFQGTLLMDFDVETMLRALRLPVEKLKDKEVASVRERVTCVREQLGQVPPRGEVLAALRAGFAEALGTCFVEGGLLPEEEALLREQLGVMQSDDYVYALRQGQPARAELRSIYKAPGGLLRTILVVDRQARQLKSALITGDFFAFPKRAIFDLEARLKDAPLEEGAIAGIVDRFYAEAGPVIPGIGPHDLCCAIGEAMRKVDYPTFGIPVDEVNSISTVVRPYEAVPEPSLLLLPYCAKRPDCAYRQTAGCGECGQCGIGDAFGLARRYGLRPITIQNYEELEATLASCRAQGARGFIGCCCQAFLAKHRDDFERLGLPGILVDLDDVTCYDLGQEQDAHEGRFDRLTHLKLGLLEAVIRSVTHDI